MAFQNNSEFEDDFRKVGQDATAGFERPGTSANPTENASSENLNAAAVDEPDDEDEEDDDLEDDEDLEDDDEEEDDLEDDDDPDDDDEEEDDLDDEDDDDDDDEDEDEDEEDDKVTARLGDAEKRARAR